MVHEARVRIANGEIGKVLTVQVEYPLEWMATGIVRKGNVQAAWRKDANVNWSRKNNSSNNRPFSPTFEIHWSQRPLGITLANMGPNLEATTSAQKKDR